MSENRAIAAEPRYVITPLGREVLAEHEVCQCVAKLAGMFVQCTICGTVYGHAKQMFAPMTKRYNRNGHRS